MRVRKFQSFSRFSVCEMRVERKEMGSIMGQTTRGREKGREAKEERKKQS